MSHSNAWLVCYDKAESYGWLFMSSLTGCGAYCGSRLQYRPRSLLGISYCVVHSAAYSVFVFCVLVVLVWLSVLADWLEWPLWLMPVHKDLVEEHVRVYFSVYFLHYCVSPAVHNIFHMLMVWYSLFVLKCL